MDKKVFKWGEFDALNKALGIKAKASLPTNEVKKKAQIEKFCKCRKCGGQMTYIKGTNTLICKCEVEKEKEKVVSFPDGTSKKEKIKVKEICGNINLVADEYMSYVNWLFN